MAPTVVSCGVQFEAPGKRVSGESPINRQDGNSIETTMDSSVDRCRKISSRNGDTRMGFEIVASDRIVMDESSNS